MKDTIRKFKKVLTNFIVLFMISCLLMTVFTFNTAGEASGIPSVNIFVGETIKLNAVVDLIDESQYEDATFEWSTDNRGVATVNRRTGDVKGISEGRAKITVTVVGLTYPVQASCYVDVTSTVTGVQLDRSELNIKVGEEITLTPTVFPADAYLKTVSWSTQDRGIATVRRGVVKGIAEGQTIITVTTDDGNYLAQCVVNVGSMVTGVTLNQEYIELQYGHTYQLVASVIPGNAMEKGVRWTSDDTSIASVRNGLVSANGLGTTVITATTNDGGHTAKCTVKVTGIPVESVEVEHKRIDIQVGEEAPLNYTIYPLNASNVGVSYSTSDRGVAAVSRSGVVTGVSHGYAEITVTTADGGHTDVCQVYVQSAVTGVKLNKDYASIYVGQEITLEAEVLPETALVKDVTWQSSNPAVVTVNRRTGVIQGVSDGKAMVTATTVDGNHIATCEVTVKNMVTDLIIDFEKIVIGVNGTFRIPYTIVPDDAYEKGLDYTFNRDIISIRDNVITGVKEGQTNLILLTKDGNIRKDCIVVVETYVEKVRIYDQEGNLISIQDVTGVSLNQSRINLSQDNRTAVLEAVIDPVDASNKHVTWSSSDENVASVDSNGKVTAVSEGTAIIKVTTEEGGFTAECEVNVTGDISEPGDIEQPGTLDITLGVERVNASTLQLTAQSSGGTDTQYQFDMRLMGAGDEYTTLRSFSADPEFTWDGAVDGGLYEMVVHVTSSEGDYKGYYVVFANVHPSFVAEPFLDVSFTAVKEGDDVKLSAVKNGGSNVIYKFEYSDNQGQSYHDVRGYDAYSSSPDFTWSGAEEGKSYYLVVHAVDISTPVYDYKSAFVSYTHTE